MQQRAGDATSITDKLRPLSRWARRISFRRRRPRRGSLRAKIITWAFVPTAIILVAVALVSLYSYQRLTENLVIERDRGQIGTKVSNAMARSIHGAASSEDVMSSRPLGFNQTDSACRGNWSDEPNGVFFLRTHGI